jgi:predicted ATPase
MQLKIEGIGKIQNSTIEMQGITVIAGKNNTGKSSYGKVLYCMFNAFFNKKEAIHNERINTIRRVIYNASLVELIQNMDSLSEKLVNEMEEAGRENFSEDKIQEIVRSFLSKPYLFIEEENEEEKEENEIINNIVEKIKRSISVDDDIIQKIIISRYFRNEFDGQINHVNRPSTTGEISLIIKEKNIDVIIENNKCDKFTDDVGVRNRAIYMDTPFVIDDFSMPRKRINSFPINHRRDFLYRLDKEYSDNTVIEEAIISQKVKDILSNIHLVTNGSFKEDKENIMFMENGLEKPIPLFNVSAGMKPFLIIKRLLELGEIKEQNVLILDEPEIHLHPEWQLQFAEILILLQKEFNLTILITTHSPYFLNALEVYSKKHEREKYCNYYLAQNKEDYSIVEDVTNKTNEIYALMEDPFCKLERLRNEDL